MAYGLKFSDDDITWHVAMESAYTNIAERITARRPVTRERLQDIYREAEFWSKKYRHVAVVFP